LHPLFAGTAGTTAELLPNVFRFGSAKRLNTTDRKQSNRRHENKITTEFVGRSESGA
jgi:hypothetical protein